MIADYPDAPPRLAPFLARWDYVVDILFTRLEDLTDEALVSGACTVHLDR